MDRRTFLQLAGAVTASQVLTAFPAVKAAQARGKSTPLGNLTYRVLNTRPDALGGYWPLDEASGNQVRDLSPHGFDGTQYQCVFGSESPGDGRPALGFDPRTGAASMVDVFSPGVAAWWNEEQGTLMYRARIYDPTQWNNNLIRRIIWAGTDQFHHISLRKQDCAPNVLKAARETGLQGTDGEMLVFAGMVTGNWFFFVHAWDMSAQLETAYLSLDQVNYCKITQFGGLKSDNKPPLLKFAIGNRPDRTQGWVGWIGRVGFWNAALTEDEVKNLIPIV